MKHVIQRDVLVVGAGHAGAQAAIALRRKGFAGSIMVASDEPTMPYERPPLSKAYFIGAIQIERLMLRETSFWDDQAIEFALVCKVDRLDTARSEAVLRDGRIVQFDWCVIATGGRARRLACPGNTLPGVYYLRTVADVDAIRQGLRAGARLAVIGGGYVGLEVAAAARELGHDVTVIEAENRVLSRVTSPIVSSFYERVHRAHGVKIMLNERVSAIEGEECVRSIRLGSGAQVDADLVVVGICIDAETALAEAAGLQCDAGILVDESCRTSQGHVLAIGDCSRHPNEFAGGLWRLESVQHANDSAEIAADLILGNPRTYCELPTFWSDQFEFKLQSAGIARDADRTVVRGDPENGPFTIVYLRDGRVIAADAINSPRDFMAARTLIKNSSCPDLSRLADAAVPLKSLV